MIKRLLLLSLFGITACVADAPDATSTQQQAVQEEGQHGPDGKGGGVENGATHAPATTNGILYHGGPVMHGTTNAYYIWYGNWGTNTAKTILTDFITSFGGSPYYNINTTYTDAVGPVTNSVALGGAVNDNYSRGTALSDADIQTIVTAHAGFDLPLDANGIYFVLTTADVNETTGFCTNYCGWHTNGAIKGLDIKYSFIGNADRCLAGCAPQTTSPNGNAGADAMASIIAHEFEETTSDPDLNAWYDSLGYENADKCAWTFGTEYAAVNGSRANMRLGARDFLIQQNWLNASGGLCVLSYGSVSPNFSLSASPSSASVVQGGTATSTITVTPSGGFTGSVTLSASGVPTGATATFSPSSTTSTSTLSIATTSSTPTGSYPITVTGVNGTLNHTATVTLSVTAPATPNFSVSASPSTQSVVRGSSTSYSTTVTKTGGFTGTVTWSASGLPAGATATFAGVDSTTVTVATSTTTATGSYPLTLTGTSGALVHSTTVTLIVTAPVVGGYTLTLTPTSRSVSAGSSTTYTVNIARTGGFTGAVSFSVTGLPSGASGSFNPSSTTGASSTLTVSTAASTPAGTFALTITGTSGATSKTVAGSLTVTAGCGDNCNN